MNFRKVILIYLVVFAWFVVYHLVLGQDEITFYTGPRVLIGPPAPVYNQPLGFNGSGNSGDLVGIGIAGYLVYTLLKFLVPLVFISFAGRSLSN